MKNFVPIMLGVASIGVSVFLYKIHKKEKEIEENCGCKKPAITPNPTGSRISTVHTNSMGTIGSGVGGGRSASDMMSVRPRGVAVATSFGADSTSSVFRDNAGARGGRMDRVEQFNSKLRSNQVTKSNPLVSNVARVVRMQGYTFHEGRVIQNGQNNVAATGS